MNFGSKLFPLECTQAKKLTDGRLGRLVRVGRHGRPHVRRTTDITVSQKLTLSKLRWAKNMSSRFKVMERTRKLLTHKGQQLQK